MRTLLKQRNDWGFNYFYQAVLRILIDNFNDERFQKLLDRIEELLKKVSFNNELIESYDEFFTNQSGYARELR